MDRGDRDKYLPQARALKAQGLSLREIGRQLGVSHVALRKWPLDGEPARTEAIKAGRQRVRQSLTVRTQAGARDWLAGVQGDLEAVRALGQEAGVDPAMRLAALKTALEMGLMAYRLTSQMATLELLEGKG